MSTTLREGTDENPTVTKLVRGIVGDVQDLGMRHLDLFRMEVKRDLHQATDAMCSLAIGLAVVQVGGILICLMLVHSLLQFVPDCPTWLGYGIVGILVAGLGLVFAIRGARKLQQLNVLSDTAAHVVQEDKEEVKWSMSPK